MPRPGGCGPIQCFRAPSTREPDSVEPDHVEVQASTSVPRAMRATQAQHQATCQAYQQGTLSFSFSGGGFLLPWHAGVMHQLLHLGLVQPGKTHLCGSSAGSLIAACITAGLSVATMLRSFLAVATDCRTHGVPRRLAALLRAQLHEHLPEDAHLKCSGLAHLGVTKLWPRPHSKIVSEFRDREDLVSALLASCYLPVLSDGRLTTRFRGKTVVDGGFTAIMPHPPASAGCSHTVRVSCVPCGSLTHVPMLNKKQQLRHIAMSPDMFTTWPHDTHETLTWALRPASHEFLLELVQRGADDALAWAKAAGLAAHLPQDKVQPAPPLAQSVPEWELPEAEKAAAHVPSEPAPRQPGAAAGAAGVAVGDPHHLHLHHKHGHRQQPHQPRRPEQLQHEPAAATAAAAEAPAPGVAASAVAAAPAVPTPPPAATVAA